MSCDSRSIRARTCRPKVGSGSCTKFLTPPPATTTEAATRAILAELGQLASPEGQAALALAAAVDSGRSLMALPAMVKELRSTLDALAEKSPKALDSVDEFAARRAARRAGRAVG